MRATLSVLLFLLTATASAHGQAPANEEPAFTLARISHQRSAATPHLPASPALRSLDLLDVLQVRLRRPRRRAPWIYGHLRRFASNSGEKSGLVPPAAFHAEPRLRFSPEIAAAYVDGDPTDEVPDLMLLVEVLPGTISREPLPLSALPESSTVYTLTWRELELEVVEIPEWVGDQAMINRNVQVPLKPNAIQLRLVGPAERDEEMAELLPSILATVEGPSNWLSGEERAGRLGEAFGKVVLVILGITAIAGISRGVRRRRTPAGHDEPHRPRT